MKFLCTLKKLISCPVAVFSAIALISAFSLSTALTAQYVYGLEPCILCLYQRAPFAMALILSLIGLAFVKSEKEITTPVVALCGFAFAANSVIAFYHTGVERKWWSSHLEGCAVPDLGNDPAQLLQRIMESSAVRCDEIPWADPVLGLSMANYNVALCAGMAVFCGLSAYWIKKN